MTLQDTIKTKNQWGQKELLTLLGELQLGPKFIPKEIQVGDIITVPFHSGHIAIVFKVSEINCAALILSSKGEKSHSIGKVENTRYNFGDAAFYTYNVVVMTKEEALVNFKGVFDNMKQVREIVKKLKPFYRKILTL